MNGLYDKLREYSTSDYYGFHMPGHKRHAPGDIDLPYGIDITEIEGFDDLHHAAGILKDAQELAAKVYGADETGFLVNGSTAGILSAILGCTRRGDRILAARHCHKSVYHAIDMNGLRPVYLYPEFDENIHMNMEISVSAVKTALMEYSDIRAAVIVSPTFDGVISDIGEIAAAVHEYGIPLIVDEAHGAHLGFHPYFEENALAKGADVVIQSVHKTLPSLTQTALLHIKGEVAERGRIFRYLDMLQSSSPSYILMASIDHCIHLLDEQPEELFEPYASRLSELRESLKGFRCLKIIETERYDYSKLVISVGRSGLTGKELYGILLSRYHLQMEMAAGTYVIAMTSPGDTPEGFGRLKKALFEIDDEYAGKVSDSKNQETVEKGEGQPAEEVQKESRSTDGLWGLPVNEQAMTSREAFEISDGERASESLFWESAIGRISAEYAYLYPPGSPLVVPGERISPEASRLLEKYREAGFRVEGLEAEGRIKVLKLT